MEELDRIPKLIANHLKEQLTENERQELQAWIDKSEGNRRFFEQATNEALLLADLKQFTESAPDTTAFSRTLEKAISEAKVAGISPWRKYIAVAASVLLFLVAGAWLFNRSHSDKAAVAKSISPKKTEVAPGHDGAVLTLADGRTMVLDSLGTGVLATQGTTHLVLDNGKLSYTATTGSGQGELIYNQIATSRGRQFRITLPDGSNVWLNAASSLRYPVQFGGRERRVEISGEAYFEVTHNPKQPFIVQVAAPFGSTEVKVLGTHFNVMAYKSEETVNTTLLEGSISLRTNFLRPSAASSGDQKTGDQKATILRPGQQARIPNAVAGGSPEGITVIDDADVDQAVAWKNGFFSFQHSDIKSLMRQVERWYDIDVVYKGDIPQRTFSGKVSRNSNLSELLQILDLNSIHFNIDGRVLTVKP
jgi:ferric-dicitrate binding protein FerR (iron transport regulator)